MFVIRRWIGKTGRHLGTTVFRSLMRARKWVVGDRAAIVIKLLAVMDCKYALEMRRPLVLDIELCGWNDGVPFVWGSRRHVLGGSHVVSL